MSKVTTPKYRVEVGEADARNANTKQTWNAPWIVKQYGKPTDKSLTRYVGDYEISTHRGGCNEHIGPRIVRMARIVEQATGRVTNIYTLSFPEGKSK